MEVTTGAATEQKSLLEVLAPGKRARLHRLLFEFGPGDGTLLLLPIDQGIEHGPRDFFANPDSKDPAISSTSPPRRATRRSPVRSGSRRSTTPTTRAAFRCC